jgi:hypothetical protein
MAALQSLLLTIDCLYQGSLLLIIFALGSKREDATTDGHLSTENKKK